MKALIAMSGGVDSSVAAKLMMEKGYECAGVNMRLFDPDDVTCVSCSAERKTSRTCCSETDAADAMAVAGRLGMPFNTLNYMTEFKSKVIDKFIDCYEHGLTPNPCIDCNRYMKFELLFAKADELGCEKVVTGHYARIERDEEGLYVLKKAADLNKDQSYVLYMLTQDQLSRIEFPLGDHIKSDTRDIATDAGFVNSDKAESQDICFVPEGRYGEVIKGYTGREYPEGDFVDKDGNVLGRHKGIIYYTLGQRKGLGISADRPLYVVALDMDDNKVVLGDDRDLFSREAYFEDINWISGKAPEEGLALSAKTRYRQKDQPGTIKKISDERYVFIFDEPVRAITPGQALVVYDGDTVIGGGTIVRT